MPPSWRAVEDLVEHVVALPGRELALLAPRDRDALLSEEAFEHEEFLPYWAELWPSALALARVVARRPLTGRRVIELGCGLGLPSIAAALAGGRVLATDWSPASVAMTARNAERNDAQLDARVFRWDAPPEPLGPPWPLVLASDVLYEARNGEQLLALLPRLTAAGGEVWLADPGRMTTAGFLDPAAAIVAHRRDPARRAVARHRPPAPSSSSALSFCSERPASRSAAPWTSTRLAIRPRIPPGWSYSLW